MMYFSARPKRSFCLPIWRMRLVLWSLLLLLGVIFIRSAYLQVIQSDFLIKQGEARFERDLIIPATRGRILDRHGNPLAISVPVQSVWAVPSDTKTMTPEQTRKLASLLGINANQLHQKLSSSKNFIYLRRLLPFQISEKIQALKLPGVHFQQEYQRQYPMQEAISQLIGFTDSDEKGLEGLELSFNESLSGIPGSRRVIKDRHGKIIDDVAMLKDAKPGTDVTISIDSHLQYKAYEVLKKRSHELKARAASIIAIDVRTGEILAAANTPSFNPQHSQQRTASFVRNRIFTDIFEPGSTMKPFTAALALESRQFNPDTIIDVSDKILKIENTVLKNEHPALKELSLSEVIQKSSNIGIAKVSLQFSPQKTWTLYQDFGFGDHSKSSFPGEVSGLLHQPRDWKLIEQATMAYGHNIAVTLAQLARAYLPFARNGDMIPLSLTPVKTKPKTTQIISNQTALSVRHILEGVISRQGTGRKASVIGYRIAGKTGTARKVKNGEYVKQYVSSFIGFAPASSPRVLIAIAIDEPNGDRYYGGDTAAPIFSEVMEFALRLLNVSEDEIFGKEQVNNTVPSVPALIQKIGQNQPKGEVTHG